MILSIIIVNYKTPQLVVDCLNSIFKEKPSIQLEVVVVDNASGDESEKIITSAFSNIKWLQINYNAGFGRANNAGIRLSKGEIVLLLNSDTLNTDNAIQYCFNSFKTSDYVACGVQLINPDGTSQISGNYVVKGGLNYLLPLPYIGNFIKWLGNILNAKKPNIPNAVNEVEVDWINGAFLMVKKEAIEKAGLIDEDFFLYAEEAEWCSRLKKTGKLCIYGQYNIIHLQGESANETFGSSGKGYYNLYDKKGLQIMLSNFVRIRKEFGKGWFLLQLAVYTITIPVFFILSFIESIITLQNPFKHFLKAAKFAKNVMNVWAFMPRIIKNDPYFYKVL
ncbi:MAG: glycosyltransferase family 2 protein [Agriterribacter sp.]